MSDRRPSPGSTALVLAGGAALGAYEVGVVRYLLEAVRADVPGLRLDILVGTSAGAINAGFLAAHADDATGRGRHLAELWSSLKLRQVLRPSGFEILGLLAEGCVKRLPPGVARLRGGVLDPRALEIIVRRGAPLHRVAEHLRAGRLRALAISATHVASGRSVSFVEADQAVAWRSDPLGSARSALITSDHVLASAAIPLLFPAVTLDGERYCDGGLRQVVPLAPALHLGAESVLVVNPVSQAPALAASDDPSGAPVLNSPWYLAGKALNALFLDRMEVDLARLDQLNAVLDAGRRRWGSAFLDDLNVELVQRGVHPVRPVRNLRLQPSRDVGRLAAEYVASPGFARRERSVAGRLLRLFGEGPPERAGDLLAYLLFDGGFAAELIDLGFADARRRHEELCRFFSAPRREPHTAAVA